MMKAGHSSGLGSDENIRVFLSVETDNLTVLEESPNIYHHFLQVTFGQWAQLHKANNSCI